MCGAPKHFLRHPFALASLQRNATLSVPKKCETLKGLVPLHPCCPDCYLAPKRRELFRHVPLLLASYSPCTKALLVGRLLLLLYLFLNVSSFSFICFTACFVTLFVGIALMAAFSLGSTAWSAFSASVNASSRSS